MLLKNIKRKRVKVGKIFKGKTDKGHEAVALCAFVCCPRILLTERRWEYKQYGGSLRTLEIFFIIKYQDTLGES